uniref:Uncharacterized protein n=1 Tax=Hyaloperonospora arabidopsidis (strain Emoy2) TaxID=559515 RepID=M4B2Q1_HYAAE
MANSLQVKRYAAFVDAIQMDTYILRTVSKSITFMLSLAPERRTDAWMALSPRTI